RPRVGEETPAVLVERSREPPAAFPLVGLEPLQALRDPLVARGHAAEPREVEDVAGAVAVARLQVLVLPVPPLPRQERGDRPAAVGPLQREQVVDGLLLLRG